jgi:tRNA/tmRNA/rRNA uracil-C5-methylase (TrmA/RlmC/RlmD family)
MNAGDVLDLTVSDVVYPGKGLARVAGEVVFVPGALPGETVRARVTAARKTFAEARLEEIVGPSPKRIAPACALAGACEGCAYQHAAYDEELRLKQRQLEDLLRKVGGVTECAFDPPCSAPAPLGYRNKIMLHAAGPEGASALGYFGSDNRTVLDVPECPLAEAPLNERLSQLRADSAFRAGLRAGDVLVLRHTPLDGVLHWIEGRERPVPVWLRETTRLGELRVHYGDFFQVNPAVADLLLAEVEAEVRASAPEAVVDAYCGVGPFALAAARAGVPAVLGMDSGGTAIRAARHNAAALGLQRVEFMACRVERRLAEALDCVPAAKTLVVVDPPRRGLPPEAVEALGASMPAQLLYVSCAPDTLARDVKKLRAAGYELERCRLFDMFPRTFHFETLCRLRA